MRESGYYPPGAEFDSNAPYNQVEIPEKEFTVVCSQSLSKAAVIYTDDYIPGASGVDYEPDDEGGYYASGWQDPDDTSGTNWTAAYEKYSMTPLELIDVCKELAQYLLDNGTTHVGKFYLKGIVEDCIGWEEDELVVENID